MAVTATTKDKDLILATLGGNPPITQMLSGTQDQRKELWRMKERHLFIKEKLAAYFRGDAELVIDGLSQFDQDSLEMEKDLLLSLYALIQGSWGDLIQLAESLGMFFSESNIYQPGEMIAALVNTRAEEEVSRILSPYYRFVPSAERKTLKDIERLGNIESRPGFSVEALKQPEARFYREVKKSMKKHHALNASSHVMGSFILNCCRKLAKGSGTHSAIRRRLAAYEETADRYTSLVKGHLHPRKGVKGWEMVKGRRRTMGKYGGVASP
ncbi:MAG: hypothetical protein ACR2FS_13465 [Phormidesmis sp.]